jgi:hypothetical protein
MLSAFGYEPRLIFGVFQLLLLDEAHNRKPKFSAKMLHLLFEISEAFSFVCDPRTYIIVILNRSGIGTICPQDQETYWPSEGAKGSGLG